MNRTRISQTLRTRVTEQAHNRCGYCLTSVDNAGPVLSIDHIVPLAQGGETVEENLWLACRWCNEHKHDRTHARDPVSGRRVRLFNPRQQVWSRHFRWSEDGTQVIGLTACGRATVGALNMNNSQICTARGRWVSAGWHPPED